MKCLHFKQNTVFHRKKNHVIHSVTFRFFACNNTGDITVDGQNIKELDLKSLRRNIGSVSQEPALFSGTIMDNLRIGKLDATDEEIIEAAKTANAHSFIFKLPDQYSTEVRLYVCETKD